MSREFRAFTAKFRRHLSKHMAWPDENAMNAFRGAHMSHGAYASLRKGNAESFDYVTAILRFLLQESDIPEIAHGRATLLAYLRSLGIAESRAESMQAPDVVEWVCGPIKSGRKKHNVRDAFERWLQLLINAPLLKRPSIAYAAPCEALDVPQAIQWMYIEAGRAVGGKRLSWDAATRQAEAILGINLDAYTARALQWRERCPWSIVHVVGDRKKKLGMCLTLPVPGDVYDAMRRGERASHLCSANELDAPTSDLVAEGLALRPREECDRSFSATKALFYAVLTQQAKLTAVPELGTEIPMRILSFEVTKANARRLKWAGYKPVGGRMAETRFPLVERTFLLRPDNRQALSDAPILGVWRILQAMLNEQPQDRWTPDV